MSERVTVREMRWWDLDGVLALERQLFPDDPWSPGMFWSELAHARGPRRTRHYVVAERDGVIVGYAGLAVAGERGDTTGDVQTIAVAEAEQGRRLGSRLLTELLDAATRFGCREVFLEVRTDNERAQRLYTRFGFQTIGVRRGYYQSGRYDALTMRRDHREERQAEPETGTEAETHG